MKLRDIRFLIGMFNPRTIWRYKPRLWFAQVVSLWRDRACWVDLYHWSERETEWEDIVWHCRDMEQSGCDRCWCGKIHKDDA